MDYPKFILSNRKEESISIQRVKRTYLFTVLFHDFQSASIKQSRKYTEKVYPQLFEYAMIVSLRQGDTGIYEPYVIYKFPEIVSIVHCVQQIIALVRLFLFGACVAWQTFLGFMYWGIVGDGVLTTLFVATQYHFIWFVVGSKY